jgi:stage II sporulation protein AA (anti-sigma F factor antagonist)
MGWKRILPQKRPAAGGEARERASFLFHRKLRPVKQYEIQNQEDFMMAAEQTFTYETRGQILIIHLPRDLDHHNCRNLKYETDLLFSENYISKVVFDFSRTEFMDSSGIGILLNRYKQMAGSGGKVTLYGVNAQIGRILAIGGIHRLMEHFDSKEAAIAG